MPIENHAAPARRSPLHDAYRAYLDGKTSLDEVLELADRVLERYHGQPPADAPPALQE